MGKKKKIAEEKPDSAEQETKAPEIDEAQDVSESEAKDAPENEDKTKGKGKKKDGKKKRKFGPVKTSVCIVSAAAIAALGTWAGIAFLRPQARNDVDPTYGSVSYEVKDGEVFTAAAFTSELKARDENGRSISGDENTYDGLDVFGRLNWMFARQNNWSSEMHSVVNTAVGPQDVSTYKRYANGILISEDITTSSMVNVAREYCYVNGERVIWRDSEQDKSQWNGMETVFPDSAPLGNMNIDGDEGFRKLNGLPATELSVYVFEQNTIESATLTTAENVSLADGAECFTVTYRLKAKTDDDGKTGAAAYYGNQMVFTGGIDAPPDFDFIEVSFTFTENWLPVRCTVSEKYTASMKTIVTTCTSESTTEFFYDVPGIDEEVQEIYQSYYKQYADTAATGQTQRPLSATDCLASAFGPLLSEPTVLDVSLTLNGQPLHGSVWLDLGSAGGSLDLSNIKARADLGVLRLWVEDGKAYLNYGNVKLSLTTKELLALFTEGEPAAQAEEAEPSEDPLEAITGGEFTVEEKAARLHSVLKLGDAEIVLDFLFDHDGNRNVTLNKIGAEANFGDLALNAEIKYGGTAPSELGEAEKAAYTDATAYAGMLKDLFTADALRAEIGYTNTEYGITLGGSASVMYKDGLALKGDFTLGYGGAEKAVSVLFDGTAVYLDVDGLKVKAGLGELETLLSFLPAATAEETDVLSTVLKALFDAKFANLLSSAGTENTLSLTVKGTELLQYFGVEYALGDVGIALTEDGLNLTALGATVSLGGGDSFTVDVNAEEYASVLPYAADLYDLFTGENLKAAVSYENTDANVSVSGEIVLGMQTLAVSATLNVTYGQVAKEVKLTYTNGNVYLLVDGLRLKASTDEIAALIGADSPTGDSGAGTPGGADILGKLLALKFDSIITTLHSAGNALEAQVALDALLKGLGISTGEISLGDLTVTVENGTITAEVLGATLTLSASETAPVIPDDLDSYTDLMPIATTVVGLVENNYIAADLHYAGEFELSGEVKFDLETLHVSAELTLTYQGAEKQLTALYLNDSVYLDVDGVKIRANVQEIKDVINSIGGSAAAAEALTPVEQLLENLGNILNISDENGALRATVALDEILKAFGYNLTLGDATLTADGETLNVSALDGALTLSVDSCGSFTVDVNAEEYASVLPYAADLYDLFTGENLKAAVSYENTDANVSVSGEIVLGMQELAVSATLNVTYGQVAKQVKLTYTNGNLYLLVDGLKLKASTDEIAALIGADSSADDSGAGTPGGADILGKLLSLRFDSIITTLHSTGNALEAQIALDALLKGLGISTGEISLGDLTVTVADGTITAEVLGATLTLSASATAPVIPDDLDSYTDLMPIATTVVGLVENNYIAADLHYNGEFELSGEVKLDLETMHVSAALTLTYQGAEKQLTALYMDDSVYFDVDGVKIRANVQEIKDVINSIGGPAAAAEALTPVEQLLENLGNILNISDENGALRATVALDEILKAFGYNLTLGEAVLTADGETLNVSALDGALTLNVKKGSFFETVTDDYVDVSGSIKQLAELFQSERIALGLTYTSERLGVDGTLTFEPATSAVHGTFTLTIDAAPRTLVIDVLNGVVYLQIDGVMLKGDTAKVVALVKDILAETGTITPDAGIPDMGTPDADVTDFLGQLVNQLLNLRFGDYLTLEAGDGAFSAVLNGTKLLSDLGVTLGLGNLTLTVSEEGISAKGDQGVELTVKAGEALPAVDPSKYTDIGAVIDVASQIVAKQGASFDGSFTLNVGETQLAVYLENAGVSWKNGFELGARVVLEVNGVCNEFHIYATANELTLRYGSIGAKIVYADFSKIGDAFTALKEKVQAIVDEVTGKATEDPAVASALSLAEGGTALAELAQKFPQLAQKLSELFGPDGIDWNALIGKIKLSPSAMADGLFCLSIGDCKLDFVADETAGVSILLNYAAKDGKTRVEGTAHAAALGEDGIHAPDDGEYLGTDEFILAIGYLGSAVDLLNEENISFTVSGSTTFKATEPDPEPTPDPAPEAEAVPTAEVTKTKYGFEASVQYHRGASVPVHLDVDGKNFWINTDLFLNVHLALVAGDGAAETDKSLYLDIFIVDGAPAKDEAGSLVTDRNLDFYVSLSQFADTDEKYSPLKIYAPADEIMTILSSAVAVLGFNLDFLDNYLVNKWLELETVAQLEAFTPTVADLMEGLLAGLLPAQPEAALAPASAPAAEERVYKNYIKSLTITDTELKLVLNSADVYGVEGIEDLAVTLTRSEGKFDSVTFGNVYDATGTENTTLEGTLKYDKVTPDIPADAASYTSFLGAEKLLLSLVKSATHVKNANEVISGEETEHEYAINENFYIDGNVAVSLFGITIEIKLIAISVTIDGSGNLGVNVRLEYQGVNVGALIGINGDSDVDLTIKNGMIYMKRVQKTYYEKSGIFGLDATEKGIDTTDDDITLYRAMPMENFAGDMLNQLTFILNFGDFIADQIEKGQSGGGGQTEPQPEENVDYGKKLGDVLTSYTYTEDATGSKWDLKLDGTTFSNGILGNMHITVSADTNGYIRSIELPQSDPTVIKIPVTGTFSLSMNAHATLNWRNPGGVMEEGASNQTVDVSTIIEDKNKGMGAMIEKLNAEGGWDDPATADAQEGVKFLEAKEFTVAYKYQNYAKDNTVDLGTQTVMVSTGADGNAENTLYSELIYPELPDDGKVFYVDDMPQYDVGQVVPSELVAQEYKHTYLVKFWSDDNLGQDWAYDEAVGKYWCDFEMEYGAKVTFMAKGEEIEGSVYTVTNDDTQEVTLPARPAYAEGQEVSSSWTVNFNATGTEFTVLYEIDTVTYHSDVAFKVEGKENSYNAYSEQFTEETYPLITPTAEGHTFLGWYRKTENGWEKVDSVAKSEGEPVTTEVEALWAADDFVTLTASRSASGDFWSKEEYNASAEIDQSKLKGAMAAEYEATIQYAFVFNTSKDSASYGVFVNEDNASANLGRITQKYSYAHVKVKVIYTIGEQIFEFEIEKHVQL